MHCDTKGKRRGQKIAVGSGRQAVSLPLLEALSIKVQTLKVTDRIIACQATTDAWWTGASFVISVRGKVQHLHCSR